MPKSYTSIPFCINAAETVSLIIFPLGRVSVAITHFFDLTSFEKLLQNSITSFNPKSLPTIPRGISGSMTSEVAEWWKGLGEELETDIESFEEISS